MSRKVPLHDLAHARAGDKGNTSNISVWAYDPGDYPLIKDQLTPERIKVRLSQSSSPAMLSAMSWTTCTA